MILAFYRVDNSHGFERNSFDRIYDNPSEILSELQKLNDDEVKFYEVATGYQTRLPSLDDFVENYNDEDLDGGWWSVLIR